VQKKRNFKLNDRQKIDVEFKKNGTSFQLEWRLDIFTSILKLTEISVKLDDLSVRISENRWKIR
jgi:hypothetical protein